MKYIIYSDVIVNDKNGFFILPSEPVDKVEINDTEKFNENLMYRLNLKSDNKNYFELNSEFEEWYDINFNYEIYGVFKGENIIEAYLKKIQK